MSPVDPPTRCERLYTLYQIQRIKVINFLSKCIDVDEYIKMDYFDIGRRITLLCVPFHLLCGFISLFFLGLSQLIGGLCIISGILTFIMEKPIECGNGIIRKMYHPYFKIYFFVVCGLIACLNVFTVVGGLIQLCGGLFYIYLFYKGELYQSDHFIVRLTEQDIQKYTDELV